MTRLSLMGLAAAFVVLGAASAEARGRYFHRGHHRHYRHHRPHYRSRVHFSLGCFPRVGFGYHRRHWSVGFSWWPSYTYRRYYAPSYRVYTYPTYVHSYPATTVYTPTVYTPVRPAPPPPPEPVTVQGWYHPTYGYWCQCHGYQGKALPHHTYYYDNTKDAQP
ncbi:MAG: hypothetical protein ACODAJ_07335 [Planctomycetota bacterium]